MFCSSFLIASNWTLISLVKNVILFLMKWCKDQSIIKHMLMSLIYWFNSKIIISKRKALHALCFEKHLWLNYSIDLKKKLLIFCQSWGVVNRATVVPNPTLLAKLNNFALHFQMMSSCLACRVSGHTFLFKLRTQSKRHYSLFHSLSCLFPCQCFYFYGFLLWPSLPYI